MPLLSKTLTVLTRPKKLNKYNEQYKNIYQNLLDLKKNEQNYHIKFKLV